MEVIDRITQALMCEVIELSEAEKDIYSGAGVHLAYFVNGELKELFNPEAVPYQIDKEAMVNEALEKAIEWIQSKQKGETWIVMCSGYELCEPRRIEAKSAADIAHLGRVLGEIFIEL